MCSNPSTPRRGWKSHLASSPKAPTDARRPICSVIHTGGRIESGRPEDISWKSVLAYESSPVHRGFFPEFDEVRGTQDDYETAEDQLEDTKSYGAVRISCLLSAVLVLLTLSYCVS